jgi:hypothetical protein|tara:strand:- start:241 stop:567 length:327 start_codon:yes stop_codon:yes gene_type:complete
MAFSAAPTGWFPGLSASATELTIPYSSLNSLTQSKSDPTTGDVRDIIYNICEAFSDKLANTATADQANQLTMSTSTSVTSSGGTDTMTKIYTVRVNLSVDDVSIPSES